MKFPAPLLQQFAKNFRNFTRGMSNTLQMSRAAGRRYLQSAAQFFEQVKRGGAVFLQDLIRYLVAFQKNNHYKYGQLLKLAVVGSVLILTVCHLVILITAWTNAELVNQMPTPLFEDCKGRYLTDLVNQSGTFGFWDVDGAIPPRVEAVFISIEDKRFYDHPGVDIHAFFRSFVNNLQGRSQQGASTIAMQIARLQRPLTRNVWNKLVEMYTGFFLIQRYGHKNVFRHYLKIIPEGGQMHGVAYAARRYFDKPLADLSWAEAALLAAIVKAPTKMNLFTYEGYIKAADRARLILQLLYQTGQLNAESYQINLTQLSELSYIWKENRPASSYHYVLRLSEKFPVGQYHHFTKPVRTSLDLDLQEFLQQLAETGMEKYRHYGASDIAMIVAEKKTGALLGYIGSPDYFDNRNAGAINYANTPRSSGSTLKPFFYALGLQEKRFTPASVLADLPLSILSPTGEYTAGNFDDEFLGPMLYRRALANSRNIPAIRVIETLGLERTLDFLKTLGLAGDDKPAAYYGYGLTLGTLYVTLEQLVSAYGTLANDGKKFQLQWGIETTKPASEQVLQPEAARQVTLFLSDTIARLPSFSRLNTMDFPFPVAVKTGTSQGYRDAWALAYSSRYIVGVWIGHHANGRMNHVAGSESSDFIRRIFMYLQPEQSRGIEEELFPLPENTKPVKICVLSGKLATIDCTQVSVEYFDGYDEPHALCDYHRHLTINRSTGYLADRNTPAYQISTKIFTIFPPEYAAWAFRKGYSQPLAAQTEQPASSLRIVSPASGSHILIDPETPRQFQSIPLRAEVEPAIKEITWMVDGVEFKKTAYPYTARWPLKEGLHTIQAKFSRANVYSQPVRVRIE